MSASVRTYNDQPPEAARPPLEGSNFVNVGPKERVASVVSGGLLVAYGLKKGSASGVGMALTGGALLFRGITGHCPGLAQLGIDHAQSDKQRTVVRIDESVIIDRPRGELYAFWRDVENLPGFMQHLESVRHIDQKHSEWTARVPRDLGTITWEAEVVEDRPSEIIAWRSLPGADIHNAGEVRFEEAPGHRGTIVNVTIEYRPPAGDVGSLAAHVMNPVFEHLIREDVRRFKQLMETGVIPTAHSRPTRH